MYSKYLPVFIQVADSGSFSKAAAALYISSTAVIKQIRAFEKHLGVELFQRSTQGVSLTASGEIVYRAAKEIIALSQTTMVQAKKAANVETVTIRIGTSPFHSAQPFVAFLSTLTPEQLRPFYFEMVTYDDKEMGMEAMLSALGEDIDCFFGLCDLPPHDNAYCVAVFGQSPCRIALPRTHPLAKRKLLTPEDFRGETLVLLPRGFTPQTDKMHAELSALYPDITLRSTRAFYSADTLNECARQKHLLVTFDSWANLHPSLVTLPVEWNYSQPYGLIYSPRLTQRQKEFFRVVGHRPLPMQPSYGSSLRIEK